MSFSSNKVELLMQRRNTKAYLDSSCRKITLERPTRIRSQAGGWIEGKPEELEPQEFRLVPFKRRLSQGQSINQEGALTVTTYALVGEHDADVKRGDRFTLDGDRYVVDYIDATGSSVFRKVAVLTSYGKPGEEGV